MQRVQRIEHDRWRTGTSERRSNLAADVPGFTHPENDDLAPRVHRLLNQVDGT